MKNSFRVMSIAVVVGLLIAAFGAAGVFAQSSEVGDNEVGWTSLDGSTDVTYVSPSSGDGMVAFFINDADLERINNGKATWSALPADVALGSVLNLVNGNLGSATSTVPNFVLDAVGFSTTDPGSTPISSAKVDPSGLASPAGEPGKVITLVPGAAGSPYEIRFTYEIVDVWEKVGDEDSRRARVTSTSDPQGELVVITETAAMSALFRGEVLISADGGARGTDDDGVYVQDGDTLTVAYLATDATTIDTDEIKVDAQAPSVTSISPADGTRSNSKTPAIRFTVTDDGSGFGSLADLSDKITLRINNEPANLSRNFLSAVGGFEVVFSQTASWLESKGAGGFGVADGSEFEIQIAASDDAGNMTDLAARTMIIDITKPSLQTVMAGGAATNIRLVFDDDLDEGSISASDFEVDGVNPSDADLVEIEEGDVTTKVTVDLTVDALDSNATPVVKIVGDGVKDVAGNALTTETRTAVDGIKPVLGTVVVDTAIAVAKDKIEASLSANEKLATGGVTVSVHGPAADTTISGSWAASSARPQEYAASGTVTSLTKTGNYGVSIQIEDVAGNTSDNLAEMKDEELTVSGGMVTVSKTPIGDSNFDGMLDGMDVTVPDGMTAGDVDASEGTVEVGGAADGATIKVTYKYTADATFEVDHDAPSVSFTPDGTADIENTSPYIRVTFDDSEYPGDSYTTSEMTDATLTGPDGGETDVRDEFQTGNNKAYLWAASGLALGSHSLEIKGEDVAGNSVTATLEFKISGKKLVEVALVPGLNLISLPGVPADTAIDAVITNPDVDFVSTYDPRSPEGFQSAVRGPNGSFGSGQTLSVIDGSKAYWVSTSSYDPLMIDIPGFGGDAVAPPPVFRLAAGWNLLAVVAVDRGTTEVDADDYLSGLKWSRGYRYDNVAIPPSLKGFTPNGDQMLTVGSGYWVYLTEAGDLVP